MNSDWWTQCTVEHWKKYWHKPIVIAALTRRVSIGRTQTAPRASLRETTILIGRTRRDATCDWFQIKNSSDWWKLEVFF